MVGVDRDGDLGDYGHDLQFGTFITPGTADPQHTVDLAVLTERVGLDLVTSAPAHDIPIWLGAGKPRMLRVVGRHADGWLPSLAWLGGPEEIDASNAIIDDAAQAAGREPVQIRRLVNVGPDDATSERLAQLALDHGFATFILSSDEPLQIERLARDVAPAVLETVASRRGS